MSPVRHHKPEVGRKRLSGSEPLSLGRPELEQVAVQVVEVVGARLHPVEVDRDVDVETGLPHAFDLAVEVGAVYFKCEVNLAPALASGERRLLLEEERPAMKGNALRDTRLAQNQAHSSDASVSGVSPTTSS